MDDTLAPCMYIFMINFGEFFLVQVLANNAAKDSSDLVSKLRSCHYLAQTKADKKHLSRYSCYIFVSFGQGF